MDRSEDGSDGEAQIPTTGDLFSYGITTKVTFSKIVSPRSGHTSDHADVGAKRVITFGTIVGSELPTNKRGLKISSEFLEQLLEKNNRVEYCSEADIETWVIKYLTDVLRATGLNRFVNLHQQASLAKGKAYIWVIESKCGRPITIIEVKTISKDILDNDAVLGQMFDYLCRLRSSFGQCELIGMVTSLEEWRFCCVPDTEEFAISNTKIAPLVEDLSETYRMDISTSRSILCSEIYKYSDPLLAKRVASCILKALNSHNRPVPLLSESRTYVKVMGNRWEWAPCPSTDDINLAIPNKSQDFIVLRNFYGGRDGHVKLAMTCTASPHLAVLKEHYIPEVRENEEKMWATLFNVECFSVKMFKSTAMVIPFVFHCVPCADEDVEDDDGISFKFDFDLARWGTENCAIPEETTVFDKWTEKLTNFLAGTEPGSFSPKNVALRAIELVAARGYVHRDIAWRHVGILPVTTKEGEVSELRPVLIDLASVELADSAHTARSEMREALGIV